MDYCNFNNWTNILYFEYINEHPLQKSIFHQSKSKTFIIRSLSDLMRFIRTVIHMYVCIYILKIAHLAKLYVSRMTVSKRSDKMSSLHLTYILLNE